MNRLCRTTALQLYRNNRMMSFVCLFIFANWISVVTSGVVFPRETAVWQGAGTTADLQEVIIGRCYNYIRVVNPGAGEKNCTAIWRAFRDAFIYKDPCSVTPADYHTFISLTQHEIPRNKALFWEKNKQLVHRYSDITRRMMPLGETLIGWLGDNLSWCGSASGDGLDSVSCPTTAECENNPMESFWRIASSTYANLSCGVIHVMLNGSVSDGTFPENSFLANFELPHLRKEEVSEVQIWIMDEVEGPDVESCGIKSVAVLQQILEKEGFEYTCTDNYSPVRMLQCVDSPGHLPVSAPVPPPLNTSSICTSSLFSFFISLNDLFSMNIICNFLFRCL